MKIIKISLIFLFVFIINTYADDIYLSCESTTKLRTSFIINDVPDPKDCLIEKINHFALTFNAYEDNQIEKEFNSNESNFYDQYFNEGKYKDSLKYLRAILFYTQRGEHMSGPSVDYDQRMRQIIKDIRSLLIN